MKTDKIIDEFSKETDSTDATNDLKKLRDTLIKNYLLSNCVSANVPLKNFMGEFEKELICRALRVSGGSQRIASFILGLKPTTLNEKIKKFKIRETRKIRSQEDLKYFLKDISTSLR